MSEQYLMYLRKSRADMEAEARGEGETLSRHEKILSDLAVKLKLNVTAIYKEIVSGETIADRPYMQRTLSEVGQGLWSGVLVMEIERLARGDTVDQGLVAQTFKYSNTKIVTPSKIFDPSNEFDEEYFEFNLFMSRREFKTINRRIQRGRVQSAKEGKFLSSVAPYGYTKVKIKNDKGYTLDINPDQAEVVRKIYHWYTVGDLQPDGSYLKLGATRIAAQLNILGIKPLINDQWSKSSITDILKNPVYIGKIRWSYRKEKRQIINNEITKTRPDPKDDNYILVNGLHPAIIDEEVYYAAQALKSTRGHAPVPGSNILKNPLTGLLYCGKCGALMTRLAPSKKTSYDVVKCPNVYCDNISAPLYLVEDKIILSLSQWLANFKAQWHDRKLDISYTQAINDKRFEIRQANDRMAKLLDQKSRIYDFLEQGVYDLSVFSDRNDKIKSEIDDLQINLNKLNQELNELLDQSEKIDSFIPIAEGLLAEYKNLDSASAKNDLLCKIIDNIRYVKTEHNKKGNRDNSNFSIEISPKIIKL